MSKKQASLLIRDQKKNLVKILATKPFKERLAFLRVLSLCFIWSVDGCEKI